MKASRFTEEQIVKALREVETGGKKAAEQQRELGISNALVHLEAQLRWPGRLAQVKEGLMARAFTQTQPPSQGIITNL